jgi:hypothetical protein
MFFVLVLGGEQLAATESAVFFIVINKYSHSILFVNRRECGFAWRLTGSFVRLKV